MTSIDVEGGTIHYRSAGEGTPPVILLHPGYVDHRIWDGHLERLARHTLTVAPDARAHGWSSTPFTPFRQCDDIAALIRHLDAGPAVLVGVSMGAGAAVDTTLEYPELVRALVISGAGTNEPHHTEPATVEMVARMDRAARAMDAEAWLAAVLQAVPGPSRTVDQVDSEVVERVRTMHEGFVRTHVRHGVVPPEHVVGSWERLGEVCVPVLGIVGELDAPDHIRDCHRALGLVADGRGVATIPGAAHFPNLEQPDAWDEIVEDFLADVGVLVRAG